MGEGIKKLLDESRLEGERKGKREGKLEGEAKGEEKLGTLINSLINAGRNDEIQMVTSDAKYRQKLYDEFGIK